MIVVAHTRLRPNDPLPPQVIDEFDDLLTRLDQHRLTPAQWLRLKVILVMATLEAADCDAGAHGYAKALATWRRSRFYDHD